MNIRIFPALALLLFYAGPLASAQEQSPVATQSPAAGDQKSANQRSSSEKLLPLPPAKHGQPAFSFSGGQRVNVQKTTADGLHEYGAGSAPVAGTGIVEVGSGKSFAGARANTGGAGITEFGSGKGTGTGVSDYSSARSKGGNSLRGAGAAGSAAAAPASQLVSTGKLKPPSPPAQSKAKPATTVVQTLGPDGKMQYKEVPFMGELSANRRDPNVTEVKDGDGKVKEYDWLKKKH